MVDKDRIINIKLCKKKIAQLEQELLYQKRELLRLESNSVCMYCLGTGQLVESINITTVPHKYGKCPKCNGTGHQV